MTKILNEGWKASKAVLTEGLTGNKRKVLETVLENQRQSLKLMESASGATSSGNIASLAQVILPVIRRVLPNVIAHELVGVVPMAGPVAQISTMRLVYANTAGSPDAVSAGQEALSPFDIAAHYTGNENSDRPGAAATADLEYKRGNSIKMQLLKQTVEAKSRRISAEWSFEAASDAESQYGLNIESEMLQAISSEITTERDQELIQELTRIAGTPVVWDMSNISGVGTYIGDEHSSLVSLINRQSNLIAQRTRLGPANWIVVSNALLSVLQSAKTTAFNTAVDTNLDFATNTQQVGTLNGAKVFVNNYASETTPLIMGRKHNEQSAAMYFCPYIPLTPINTIIDPNTLSYVTAFIERYGLAVMTNSANSLANSGDYLSAIAPQNLRFY